MIFFEKLIVLNRLREASVSILISRFIPTTIITF